MASLFTNLVQKVVISRKWTENGLMLDRERTDEVAEKSARMSTVWAMLWVKLVNLVNLVMQICAESLKSLKCLMQIFVESAKSAKSIFATFATSATANFVGKASCESTVRYRERSRIPSCYLRYSLDSHLSRFSLASLICLCMLCFGVGEMWGATYTYDFTKGSSTSYWTSDNSSTSVGTSNIGTFYYMQPGYSGHCFSAGNGSSDAHNHKFNTTKNSECFFLGKTGEYLTLPTYSGQLITSVTVYMRTGQGSASAKINIFSGSTAASTEQTASTSGATFAIDEDYQDDALSIKLTNNNNTSIQTLVVTTAVDGCEWSETFSLCAGTGGNDGAWNGSIAASTMAADNTGWTFSQEKAASQCGKFGTGSYGGSAQTPTLTGLLGTLTVKFKAGAWNAASEGTTLNLATTYGTLSQSSVTLAKGKWTDYTVTITGVTTATKITFSTDGGYKRFFLDDICVFEGTDCADPSAPGNSSVSGTGVTISTSSSSANYDIYYSTSSTTPTTQDPTATISSGNSKAITGLSYGTTYYYWMRKNCGGGSTSSWVAGSPTTFTTTVPAPTGLSVTPSLYGVTFGITDANNVNNYEIYYSTTNSAPGASPSGTATTTTKSKEVTGLPASTTYYCWVRAKGPNANSSWYSAGSFATLTLSSISVSTAPTKTKYLVGDNFDPTGLVITRTYSNSTSDTYTYSGHTSEFSFSPALNAALDDEDDAVTITYGGQTVDQSINVYTVTVNKVNISGTAIADAGVSASCSGRTLSQSVGSTNYKFNTYAVTAGGVGISGSTITGTPTGDVTINAKFHDPITVTWKVGTGAASGSPTGEVKYGTAITTLPSTPADNALASCGTNKFMGWSASELTGTGHSAPADLFTTTGGATALTENTTYRAVFANQTSGYVNTTVVEDFEKQGTSSTYNSTQRYSEANSNASIGWVMYYGTNSTNDPLIGSKGAQMRWYSSATSNYPYIQDTTKLLSLSKLKFKARVGNTNVKMDVSYSTNNGITWTTVADGATMTTTKKEYSYDIPGASATKYIIKIGVNSSSTAPSSDNYKFYVDSVAFTYKVPGTVTSDYQTGCCTAPGTALSITSSSSVATGGTVSLMSTGGNGGTVTWSVVNGTGSATISDGVLTAGSVGTVTVKAHQNANTVLGVEYCAQDAEQTFTVVSSTVNVTGVEVSPTTKAIVPGETFDITPTISPSNATDKSVSWSSSASDKASVSSGTVTGVAAGSATITCTTTDGSYTDETAVTVYAVTMQALDEDGNAIAVGGPSTPSRSGASISPAADAGNYVFKEWAISGAELGSSASTKANTITNPTGAVTVTAKYYKPRVVKWSVNGDDSYEEGSPTLKVAYNGTISAVPDAPDDDALNNCANKFMGWSTKNFGSTPKTTASGQYDDLFTSASGYTTGITDATTTFYAVYAELTPSITSWSAGSYYMIDTYNDHYYALTGDVSSGVVSATDVTDAVTYDSELGTIALNPSHSSVLSTMVYTLSLSEGVYSITTSTSGCIKSSTGAGLTGCGGSNVWNQLDKDDADATRRFGFVCSGESRTILYNSSNGFKNFATSNKGGSNYGTGYFYLVPQTAATNYVTQCASTQVRVNYAGNGGSAPSCSSGVTTKSDSYTICSTEPTKSYYDFAGWNDGTNTYDAGDSYDLQDNTTFTAQWTPTEYDITYELDGGTNDGDNPATYTIEDEDIVLGEPTKDHYRFDGWYQTYSAGVFSNPITTISSGSHGDITIYAKWVAAYVITWDNPMGASVASTMVDEGSALGDLPVPSGICTIGGVTYSNFVGWYTGTISGLADAASEAGTQVTSATIPTGDVTYHAVYTNKPNYSSTHTSNVQLPTSDPTYCSLTHIKVSSSDGAPTYKAVKMGTGSSTTGNSFTISVPIGTTSLVLHGVGWKDKTANVLISGADGVSIDPDEKQQLTAHGNATGTIDGTKTTVFATHDTETFSISGIDAAAKQTITITQVDERIIVWGINAVVPSGSTAKYVTKCCSNLVTLNGGSPTNGSVTFSPSGPIGTCDEDAEVTMTITPTSGYQLATFSVATGDGKVATKSMSADVVLNNNSSSAQEIDLTFAEDAVGSYDVTATFTEKTVTGWTFTNHAGGATITDEPIEIYVNQRLRADIAYSPTPLVSSHTSSTSYNYPNPWSHDYLKSPNRAGDYFTIDGKASTNGETTSVTLTHNDGPTKTIYLKVLPLPVDHYLDLVHGVEFADQAATATDGVVTLTYTAPGGDQSEWTDEYANTCEQTKVKLVGWVESEYADACIAADSFPTTDALKADSEHFFEVGAEMTASNKTYYAVWAEKE